MASAFLICTILQPMAAKARAIVRSTGMPTEMVDNIEKEIINLQTTLSMIQGLLQLVEENQINNDFFRIWLRRLDDIGFKARDVLDDCITFSSCITRAQETPNSVNFTSSLLLSCVNGSSSDTSIIPLAFLNRLEKDIRSVRERFDETFATFPLQNVEGGGGSESVQNIIATNVDALQCPPNLTYLKVDGCSGNAFPNFMTSGNNVANFQSLGLHNYLRKLDIADCHGLKLLKLDGLMFLKHLVIEKCSNLACITPSLQVASTVEEISITICEKLKRIDCESLPSLTDLSIIRCDEIVSIPHLVRIERLDLNYCGKLRSLTIGRQGLVSLNDLDITVCPLLESIYDEGSTSSSLTASSTLPILSNLQHITTDKMLIFRTLFNHELLSITTIRIYEFNRVERFGDIVQNKWKNLDKLVRLSFFNCEDLKSLSAEFQYLRSLEFLRIWDCPKLESLPAGGLPDSLESLKIGGCPLLYERCKDESGSDWEKIKHVSDRKILRGYRRRNL